ncbi:MAG: glycosyltransferase [Pseudomonadota bacterium]
MSKSKPLQIAIFGQIDGPIGGQSRLTMAFRDGTTGNPVVFDFHGHKSALAPLQMVWQSLQVLFLTLLARIDVAYIAMSRTTFGMMRDLLLLLPVIMLRRPIVAHVHGAEFEDFYRHNAQFARVKAFYLRHVTAFVFVNEVFVPVDPELAARSTFVRNPIPTFAVKAIARRTREDERDALPSHQEERADDTDKAKVARRCFGFISSFDPQKGIDLFLDAADRYADRADFVIAGGPSHIDRAYGLRLLERINTMPSIRYLGYLSDPTPFYDACDFMIFPTNFASETSSLVVIEALATCTHPIVRRHNRLVDIFGAAPVSWFDDASGLHAVIDRVLDWGPDHLRALNDRGAPWVQSYFPTEDSWVSQVDQIVTQAANGERSSRSWSNSK